MANASYIQMLVNMIPQPLNDWRISPGSVVQIVRTCPICDTRLQTPIPTAVRISPDDLKMELQRIIEWQKKATRELMLEHIETEHPLEVAKAALRMILD